MALSPVANRDETQAEDFLRLGNHYNTKARLQQITFDSSAARR